MSERPGAHVLMVEFGVELGVGEDARDRGDRVRRMK
jgi:hypothetical protein